MSEIKKHLLNQIESSNQFFWLKSRHFLVSKFIDKYGIKNVVDVGAGIGGLGDALKKNKNVEYFFIEIDEKSQKVLEEKFGTQHNLLNKTKNFDGSKCIAFLDVIEHVKNPDEFINEQLSRFESAYIIITVPAYQFLWSNWDVMLGHFRRYTKKDLINLTKSLKIHKIEANYIFPELLPASIMRKVINSKKITFPNLPSYLNKFLYLFSLFIQKFRKIIPFGLSVFYVGFYEAK